VRRRDYYWSLYHDAESNKLDNLRTDQVEAIFAAIPPSIKSEWWVWRDGMTEWKPFEDFPELLTSLRNSEPPKILTPPLPNRQKKSAGEETSDEAPKLEFDPSDEVEFTLIHTGIGEDRSHHRFEIELDVRIIVGAQSFPNRTVNVSLKGMQLQSPLPKNLPPYFNVEIRKKNTVIPVVCSEVKNADGGPSNRVKIEVNDHAPALLAILLAGN